MKTFQILSTALLCFAAAFGQIVPNQKEEKAAPTASGQTNGTCTGSISYKTASHQAARAEARYWTIGKSLGIEIFAGPAVDTKFAAMTLEFDDNKKSVNRVVLHYFYDEQKGVSHQAGANIRKGDPGFEKVFRDFSLTDQTVSFRFSGSVDNEKKNMKLTWDLTIKDAPIRP